MNIIELINMTHNPLYYQVIRKEYIRRNVEHY